MDETCFLCRNAIKNEIINLKTEITHCTKINLFEFLENIAPNISLLKDCDRNICHSCFTLINDLDLAQKKCLDLSTLLIHYLDNNIGNIKTESTETYIQPDLLCDSTNIKDENETLYVENVLVLNICNFCQEEFDSVNALALHIKEHHQDDKLDLKLPTEDTILEQFMTENKTKPNRSVKRKSAKTKEKIDCLRQYKCEQCEKGCNTAKKLRSRLQTEFISLNALALHIKKYHQDDKLDTQIPMEDKIADQVESENKTKLNKTVKKKLVKKKENTDCLKPYKCEQCEKTWKTATELKNHIQTHSDLRPFICEICGQSYKLKSSLNIHVGMHNGINPFTCVYCKKSYTQKISLIRHMPIHTGECPYQCDLCGKRFIHRSSFRIHQATHSGQKDFKCEVCGIMLVSGSHLKRHMRVHTGEKKFECPTCKKKFAERYNLMSHLKLHAYGKGSNAKQHKCEICNLSFQRPNKLEKHKKSKHQNIDFAKSDECDNLENLGENEADVKLP